MEVGIVIVAAKRFHNGAGESVAKQVGRKNLTVEFPAAKQPRQPQVECQIQERVIELGWMHRQKFLKEDNLRHVLITTVLSPEAAAQWNNKLQAFCESVGKGIPANNSSDRAMRQKPRQNTTRLRAAKSQCGPVRWVWRQRSTPQ